jgi:hypothetical protein
VAALLNLEVVRQRHTNFVYFRQPKGASTVRYSVVSLNYDLVVERAAGMIKDAFPEGPGPGLSTRTDEDAGAAVILAKLHGSVDPLTIVPPTWSKGHAPDVREQWKRAWSALSSANEIRILGYSLPTTDSNVRFLLKAAINATPHLKHVDVICQDDGDVRARYDASSGSQATGSRPQTSLTT